MADKDEEFSIWLLLHIAMLQNNDSNEIKDSFVLVEKILQSSTKSVVCDDLKLLRVLRLMDPLLTDMWITTGKLEPYLVLWEHFYKNLNNASDDKIPKMFKDAMETIERSCNTSYEYFVSMLCRHLVVHPRQWSKLRGRVYSRLPPHKTNEYSDVAVYQISLLFLMLAKIGIGVVEKLHSLLEGLTDARQDTEVVWIIHITMIIVNLRENQDVATFSFAMKKLLMKASEHREQFHLVKHFVDALNTIMNVNDNFSLNQHLLIGPWIGGYIIACSHTDLCQLLNIVVWILERVKRVIIFRRISEANVGWKHRASAIRDVINVKVTSQFLSTLLKEHLDVPTNNEHILIQAWIKCCLLCVDFTNEDLS